MIKKDCLRASSYRSEYYHIVIVLVLLVLVVEADLGEKDRSKGNFRLRV
jgi:hypothetical protein